MKKYVEEEDKNKMKKINRRKKKIAEATKWENNKKNRRSSEELYDKEDKIKKRKRKGKNEEMIRIRILTCDKVTAYNNFTPQTWFKFQVIPNNVKFC